MSSTKRYKQPSENNHRFQDIPPRFKRQKSITSHKSQSAMESINQNGHPFQKANGSTIAHQKASQFPREGRKIVKKLYTQRAQQSAEENLLKPSTQPFVLSPMENKLFNICRNDETENTAVPESTDPTRTSSSPCHQQTIPLCDSFTNNFNIPSTSHHNTPNPYSWNKQNVPVNSQFTSPEQLKVSPSYSPISNESPKANYSDPDIRTIEMLRELERVADQTDVGNEESSNDKNSLVSHHLRMLMCAVDRYTQGVDDEVGSDSCDDEALPQNIPQDVHSPPQIKIRNVSPYQDHSDNESAFSEDNYPASKPVVNFANTNHQLLDTWNPWSTPSFNALDVYAYIPPNGNSEYVSYPSPMSVFDYNNINIYCPRGSF